MAAPPSYLEATSRPHWLALAAPFVRPSDHPSLCLVSRRCWSIFAPRLWADLLTAVRRFGLDPGDATRALVRVLDARHFAKDVYHFASDRHGRLLDRSFGAALELLPNVDCILLDGHADLNPAVLFSSVQHRHCPRLLSIAGCALHLPGTLFAAPCLQSLVLLDVSGLPGSILPLLQPGVLPNLQILKLRQREIDDAVLGALAQSFSRRLWSLDVSDNYITDAAIDTLRDRCMPASSLRSGAHFHTEGDVVSLPHGTAEHGQFLSIADSQWSGTFSHPERHFADAPAYVADAAAAPHAPQTLRLDGASPVRGDSVEAVARRLSQTESYLEMDDFRRSCGITHLHLSRNQVSSIGIQKLLRVSSGHLEELDCCSMPLLPRSSPGLRFWPASARLYGILGAAHLFRPVMSSNLRALRIHHSLVTHVPTLEVDGLSTLARLYLAETLVLGRVQEAYPQAFVPDMNPRLTHLALACIPRRSSGPLVDRLIEFIRLLSIQERAIENAAAAVASSSATWHSPRLLQGLRHLTLEFEPDPMEDGYGDLAADELMDQREFSFFRDERAERRGPASARPHEGERPHSAVVASPPEPRRERQQTAAYEGRWNGKGFVAPVWVGPDAPGANRTLDEYRRLVEDEGLRHGVGPATPSQLLAGAPDNSHVFHTAWCTAVMPPDLRAPAADQLAGMKDVVAELKAYRRAGRCRDRELRHRGSRPALLEAPSFFWKGDLSVSTKSELPFSFSSWR